MRFDVYPLPLVEDIINISSIFTEPVLVNSETFISAIFIYFFIIFYSGISVFPFSSENM
jgi:hypothetical protein